MKRALISLSLIALAIIACRTDPALPTIKPLDLNAYGIPMVIQAPDSTVVVVKNYQFMRDITIRKGVDFDIQLFEFASSKADAAGEKLHQLASVREDPFFRDIIREDDHGFIYSKQLDSLTIDYDFRKVKFFGERELVFQTGIAGSFTLDQVTRMYKSIP
jgi:hypothetical protein